MRAGQHTERRGAQWSPEDSHRGGGAVRLQRRGEQVAWAPAAEEAAQVCADKTLRTAHEVGVTATVPRAAGVTCSGDQAQHPMSLQPCTPVPG